MNIILNTAESLSFHISPQSFEGKSPCSVTLVPEGMDEKNLRTWYSPAYLPGCTSGLAALEYSFNSLEDH